MEPKFSIKRRRAEDVSADPTSTEATVVITPPSGLNISKPPPLQHVPSTIEMGANFDADYILGKELGRGSFSVVYECTNRNNGEKRAVKVIESKRFKLSTTFKAQNILDEVRILRSLSHPMIIQLYDIYEGPWKNSGDALFIVSELATGGELFDSIISAGNFSEQQARHV